MNQNNLRAILLLGAGAVVIAGLTLVVMMKREDREWVVKPCTETGSKGAIYWDRDSLPLPVYLDQLAADDWSGSFLLAARKFNDGIGVPVFREPAQQIGHERSECDEVGMPRDPVVFVTRINSDGAGEGDEKGHARLHWDAACRLRCVELFVPGLAPKEFWEQIAVHEMGHALGLDHDDFEESIMFSGGKSMRWGMDKLTDKDRELLHGVYGR